MCAFSPLFFFRQAKKSIGKNGRDLELADHAADKGVDVFNEPRRVVGHGRALCFQVRLQAVTVLLQVVELKTSHEKPT